MVRNPQHLFITHHFTPHSQAGQSDSSENSLAVILNPGHSWWITVDGCKFPPEDSGSPCIELVHITHSLITSLHTHKQVSLGLLRTLLLLSSTLTIHGGSLLMAASSLQKIQALLALPILWKSLSLLLGSCSSGRGRQLQDSRGLLSDMLWIILLWYTFGSLPFSSRSWRSGTRCVCISA